MLYMGNHKSENVGETRKRCVKKGTFWIGGEQSKPGSFREWISLYFNILHTTSFQLMQPTCLCKISYVAIVDTISSGLYSPAASYNRKLEKVHRAPSDTKSYIWWSCTEENCVLIRSELMHRITRSYYFSLQEKSRPILLNFSIRVIAIIFAGSSWRGKGRLRVCIISISQLLSESSEENNQASSFFFNTDILYTFLNWTWRILNMQTRSTCSIH